MIYCMSNWWNKWKSGQLDDIGLRIICKGGESLLLKVLDCVELFKKDTWYYICWSSECSKDDGCYCVKIMFDQKWKWHWGFSEDLSYVSTWQDWMEERSWIATALTSSGASVDFRFYGFHQWVSINYGCGRQVLKVWDFYYCSYYLFFWDSC